MTFDQLTAEQQALLTAFVDGLFRPIEGEVNRSFGAVQHMLDSNAAGVGTLLAGLDPATVLPMTTGLAGAQPRTAGDIISALASYTAACASFNTDAMRQSRIMSAGISATAP
jgi:hypothetical protein